MAFVKRLHYWCKGDQQSMNECFRSSCRMRPKWDEAHASNGATYGEMTIRKLFRTNVETFGGRYVKSEGLQGCGHLSPPSVLSCCYHPRYTAFHIYHISRPTSPYNAMTIG